MDKRKQNQKQQFEMFVNTLFPKLEKEFIEIRAFKEGWPPFNEFLDSTDSLLKKWKEIAEMASWRDVYIGVCPRSAREGRKEFVKKVWHLWVDVDAKDFKGGKPEALNEIHKFKIPPTMIIDSGHGYHVYWLLQKPVEIANSDDLNRIEVVLKGLATEINGDIKSAELARILRIPGTFNRKYPEALVEVTLVECTPERQYALEDFGPFRMPTKAPDQKRNEPGWIERLLQELGEGNRDDSFARITGKLHREGWSPDAIYELLLPHAERAQTGKHDDFTPEDLRREIDGICRRYEPKNSSPSQNRDEEMETDSGPLKVLSLADFIAASPPPVESLVDQLVPSGKIISLSGVPEAGKSLLALEIAIEIARPDGGIVLGQFPARPGTVLLIDEESYAPDLVNRLKKMLKGKNLSPDALRLHVLHMLGIDLAKKSWVNRVREVVGHLKPDLTIIDSYRRIFEGDENTSQEVRRVNDALRNMVRDYKCTVLIIDHIGKVGYVVGSKLTPRGSSEKLAILDLGYAIRFLDNERIVEPMKSRYTVPIKPFKFGVRDLDEEAFKLEYLGDGPLQSDKDAQAIDFVRASIADNQWHARLELVELGKKAKLSEKSIDRALISLWKNGELERQERKPESGPGGKQAFYRLNPEFAP